MLTKVLSSSLCNSASFLEPLLKGCTVLPLSSTVARLPKAYSTTSSNIKNTTPLQLLAQLDVLENGFGLPIAPTNVGSAPDAPLAPLRSGAWPLTKYKAQYPPEVWNAISDLFRGKKFPDVVDVDCTGGRSAVELAKRGFRVMGIESSANMLAQTQQLARSAGVELQLLGAERERELLRAGCADLFTVMHGFHLLDVPGALAEAHRILRPDGFVVAAWNDRQIDMPLVEELEDIMESYNPQYNRAQKQRDPEVWAPILTQGNLFQLHHYSKHLHTLQLLGFKEFTNLVFNLHAMKDLVRNDDSIRRRLQADLRALVLRHSSSLDHIPVPMETELYMLARN